MTNEIPDDEEYLMFSKRVERAAELVVKAHSGQFRKDGSTPYYKHPFAVAKFVQKSIAVDGEDGEIILISALAHDCVEDVDEFDLDEFVNAIYLDGYEKEKTKIKEIVLALTKNDSIDGRHNRDIDSYNRILYGNYSGIASIIKLCEIVF